MGGGGGGGVFVIINFFGAIRCFVCILQICCYFCSIINRRVSKFKSTYILGIIICLLASCRQTKHVPVGKCLVKKNVIHVEGGPLEESDLEEIIRQTANFKTLGLKLKLRAYNLVDSSKVSEKRIRKNNKLDRINHHIRLKQNKINDRRIEKARKKVVIIINFFIS